MGRFGRGFAAGWILRAAWKTVLTVLLAHAPWSRAAVAAMPQGPDREAEGAQMMAEIEARRELMTALMNGDEATVLGVLQIHPELVRSESMGPYDAWGFAAGHGFTNLLSQLLQRFGLPKPDPQLGWRTPALAFAARGGWPECVRMLLEAGADPNELSDGEGTPAFHLIQGFHGEGMLPGFGPSHEAPPEQRARATELILAAGANLFLTPTNGVVHQPLQGAQGLPEDALVRLLTRARPDRQGNERGDTLLHAAAALGSTQSVAVLVARGMSVGIANAEGWTPLHSVAATLPDPWAGAAGGRPWGWGIPELALWTSGYQLSMTSRVAMARQLVSLGARHDVFTAAGLGDEAALAEVLAQAPDAIRRRDARGRTALHWAALGGQSGIIPKLIAAGADPGAVDREGNTALHLGLVTLPPVTLEALIEARVPLNRANADHQVALSLALHDRSAFERLLRAGARVDPEGADAPLLRATERVAGVASIRNRMPMPMPMPMPTAGMPVQGIGMAQSAEMDAIRRLLSAGARLNPTNQQGRTPLELACRAGALNLVEVLVKAGADLNAPSLGGGLTWMTALRVGGEATYDEDPSWRFRAVSQLPPQAGQALQAVGMAPSPPRSRQEKVLPFLQGLGARLDAAGALGQTALHRLAVGDDAPRYDRFFGPEALDDSLPSALMMRYGLSRHGEPPVASLVASGVAVDARDRDGNTAWLLAWQHVRPNVARALRKAGADVHATNALGQNAFHLLCLPEPAPPALEGGPNRMPKFAGPVIGHLVRQGVDPKVADVAGRTPLHFAVDPQHPTFVAVELVENGADPRAKDRSGKTPMDLAEALGRGDLVEFFKDPVGKNPFRQPPAPEGTAR